MDTVAFSDLSISGLAIRASIEEVSICSDFVWQ